jgi:hypothetical protein
MGYEADNYYDKAGISSASKRNFLNTLAIHAIMYREIKGFPLMIW